MMSSSGFLARDSRQRTRRISTISLILTIAFGLWQIYACRYELDPDSMDYLDIARQVATGHWAAIANDYWGTLNSVLMAPLFLFHPTPALELTLAHLESIFILLAAFFSFRFFLHAYLDTFNKPVIATADSRSLPEWALSLLGYGLFLWTSLVLVPVKTIGPDLLVTVFVYLAAAMLLSLSAEAPPRSFLLFGLVLGVGYWAKAIMFPISLIFLCVSIVKVRNWKRSLTSVLAFSIAAAPLLLALSLPRGGFTFGDSGKINYSSFVSPGGRVINWQGDPVGSGIPKHPTRRIAGELPIYEFNGPIAGTYPPSYDPSYWNQGRRATFNPWAQLTVVARHIPNVTALFFVAQPSLTAGFLFLFFFFWHPQLFLRNLIHRWDLLAISFAIVGLYMLVHFETRFVGAFLIFVWLSAFMALHVPADGIAQRIGGLSIVALVAAMLLSLTSNLAKNMVNEGPESAFSHVEIAQQLRLPPGTPVAVIGQGNFAYWAHLSQVRIVAEIMGTEENAFWRLPAQRRQDIYVAFRTTGARWLIAQPPTVLINVLDSGWQQIGTTSYYRYPLSSDEPTKQSKAVPPRLMMRRKLNIRLKFGSLAHHRTAGTT